MAWKFCNTTAGILILCCNLTLRARRIDDFRGHIVLIVELQQTTSRSDTPVDILVFSLSVIAICIAEARLLIFLKLITYPVIICEAYVFRQCQYMVDVRQQDLGHGEAKFFNADYIIIVQILQINKMT